MTSNDPKLSPYLSCLFLSMIYTFILSCGSSSFVDSNIKERNAALAEAGSVEGNSESEQLDEDSEEEIIAEVPAVISGAYLSCQYDPEESDQSGLACSLDSKHLEGVSLKAGHMIEIGGKSFQLEKVWEEDGATLFTLKVESNTMSALEQVVDNVKVIPPAKEPSKKPVESPLETSEKEEVKEEPKEDEDLTEDTEQKVEVSPVFTEPSEPSLKIIKNQPTMIQLTGSSDSGRAVTFEIVTQPTSGTISAFDPGTGVLTYTPLSDFVGTDTFTFVIKDEMFSSQEFIFEVETLEPLKLSDDFERVNPVEGPWIQSQNWGNGVQIYGRQTTNQSSLFLFGNGDNTGLDNIQIISGFTDFTNFSTATISASYLVLDVGDDMFGSPLPQETMNIKICVKSTPAECGIDPKNESLLNDSSVWTTIYTPPAGELNNGERNCRDQNWNDLDLELNFDDLEGNHQDFRRSNVSIMLEAHNFQNGMEDLGNLNDDCNDVVIFDNIQFEGTGLTP